MTHDLVFDVGMHLGEDTAFYLAKGYRVAGFEANAELIERCRKRFESEIRYGRLQIYAGALRAGEAADSTKFFVNPKHSDWGTATKAWSIRNESAFRAPSYETVVPTIHLERVLNDLGRPLFAKIDIEGLDQEILKGFETANFVPEFISIESTKVSWEHLVDEIELLASMGYTRFKAVQQRTIPKTTIRTTDVTGREITYLFERHSSGPFGADLSGWVSREEIISAYRRIFRDYALWGDSSWLQRQFGRKPIAAFQTLLRTPLPGWYDTHARLR